MTDDQRADGTLDVMPQTRRRIGRQGVTFTDAHATTPKCCPSRASFFTGRYAHNHGVISNSQGQAPAPEADRPAARCSGAGYRTAIFGKYLNAWPVEVNPPFFDEWAISNGGFENTFWNMDGRVADEAPLQRPTSSPTRRCASSATPSGATTRSRGSCGSRRTRRTCRARRPRATAARRLPAFPLTPAMQETDLSDKPDFLEKARDQEDRLVAARDDGRRSLKAVDEMVGRLMDALKDRDEADNTLVVFTSDNGFMLGEHGGVVGKDLPYPASTGIPLLVRWPGHFRAGPHEREARREHRRGHDAARRRRDRRARPTAGRCSSRGRRKALLVESRGSYSEDRAPRAAGVPLDPHGRTTATPSTTATGPST